ncbi:thiamine diphosphokinase [Parabacteroides sp. PF5-6]|uniref:thiamine diphosphokinase n=1 Tax=Parabacteroides sp. PF5-6 TaxID=1742403 RepID=UPI002405921F|nr:thiamine diphosphokinase [Parabacteroides sp. PF5-6]MDF9830867.1 thiamine pyrophosphokinase [Parabacteroides sp. PF5-6]
MIGHYPCVVVADGLFPTKEIVWDKLRRASVVIACDGAVEKLVDGGIIPTAIVGDMDSIPSALREKYADRLFPDHDQETNDLTKAMQYARRTGQKEVLILGATGLREDHTLGNISLLMDYLPLFDRVEMASDFGLFTPINQTTWFACRPGQQVSFFSLRPGGEVTTHKLRYPLVRKDLTAWWQGTLNETLEEEFGLELSPESRMILFREY